MADGRLVDPTAIVAFSGRMSPFEWISQNPQSPDPYSVFTARAEGLGWTDRGGNEKSRALWGMNDAGQGWSNNEGAGSKGLLTWFQVGLTEEAAGRSPLPVQPLVDNGWNTTAHFGDLDVSAVQVLLPIYLAASSVGHIVSGLPQFFTADPRRSISVEVELDTGDDSSAVTEYSSILDGMTRFRTEPFRIAAADAHDQALLPAAAVFGDLRMGGSRHRARFAARIPTWTAAAVGWLVLLVTEGARAAGVSTSATVAVRRTDG